MIVFDLKCAHDHVFEAWFGSSAAFEDQRARGLVACPLCGDTVVAKAVMAPNLAAKGNSKPAAVPVTQRATPDTPIPPDVLKAALQSLAKAQLKALETSQWVGGAFADRARAMHAGEEDHAPIHGQSTIAEAKALVEDGVPIAPLLIPIVPPEALN
ncbi:hypothetical protein ASG11_17910 [Sphingomonas sp. Leaf357]|uniref:DUF1178 family protein n=1 Tax=Sphingomonas sp. Leaf357 TaxID=1736350 RepID=UPI0006FA11EF|nr:DUF1178 family protein [Sphingomonas sp. Leaf357]KQS01528.1 hypothetical protein ASG11_17910 [Sphingomonas sp. Leaf357]